MKAFLTNIAEHQDARMDKMDARLDAMEARIEKSENTPLAEFHKWASSVEKPRRHRSWFTEADAELQFFKIGLELPFEDRRRLVSARLNSSSHS